jgi:hypothetical protein
LLGLAVLFFFGPIFRQLGITSTADAVCVQLAAGLIAIMGLGFAFVWREPLINRDIAVLGAVFKAFYILLAIAAQLRGELPHPVFLLFAGIDAVVLIIILFFLQDTRAAAAAPRALGAGRTAP